MSKAYAFALGQRVNVPGEQGVQGVVSMPRHSHEMHLSIRQSLAVQIPISNHVFFLRWLSEDGTANCGWFGDFEITFTNAPGEPVAGDASEAQHADRSVQGTTRRLRRQTNKNRNRRRNRK